jgi:uncharacterized protein (TIGR00730 family)
MNKMTREVPDSRQAICVFCGSNHGADPAYTEAAQKFGTLIARENFDLVFGGGGVGLMGEVALSVARGGGKVLGIIPNFLRHLEPPLKVSSKIVITESMNERKARMFAACDGFAILPGGLGTLDEFAEAFTGAQLKLHAKPIVQELLGPAYRADRAFRREWIRGRRRSQPLQDRADGRRGDPDFHRSQNADHAQ